MGLLLDLSPDGGMDDEGNDEELEAELLSLVGGGGGGRSQGKKGEGRGEKDKDFVKTIVSLTNMLLTFMYLSYVQLLFP